MNSSKQGPLPRPQHHPECIAVECVWRTLTTEQRRQVLHRLVTMCQECLIPPPGTLGEEVDDEA